MRDCSGRCNSLVCLTDQGTLSYYMPVNVTIMVGRKIRIRRIYSELFFFFY